jgi:dCTP deaminase
MERGWLSISPKPSPPRPQNGVECPYQTSAIDLRLANEISYFKEGLPAAIDLRKGKFRQLFGQNSESRTITDDQPYSLSPNKMVLGKTLETIKLPIVNDGPCLAARIEGRSSYARCGLLVHFTAPTIHAGYEGTITLELINLGIMTILLYPGVPICQLIVEQVDGVPFRNDSQFHGQATAGGIDVASPDAPKG